MARKFILTPYQCFKDVYDATTGEHLQRLTSILARNVMWNTYEVNAFSFSPDGKIFASGGRARVQRPLYVADAAIELWDTDTGMPIQTLKSPWGKDSFAHFFTPIAKYSQVPVVMISSGVRSPRIKYTSGMSKIRRFSL